jgi:hypothetical protein
MALYIPHSIFHLARLLYVRPETFGLYYVSLLFIGIEYTSSEDQSFSYPLASIRHDNTI